MDCYYLVEEFDLGSVEQVDIEVADILDKADLGMEPYKVVVEVVPHSDQELHRMEDLAFVGRSPVVDKVAVDRVAGNFDMAVDHTNCLADSLAELVGIGYVDCVEELMEVEHRFLEELMGLDWKKYSIDPIQVDERL